MTRYVCIVKVGQEKFVKYHTNDLLKFVIFLDSKYVDWRFFNVFCFVNKTKIDQFTKNKRPINSIIRPL